MSYPTSTFVLNNIHFSQVNNEIIVILNIYIQKGWNDFVYYRLKCLDFNKGLYVLGYLGVEQNENESWVDMSWLFHGKGWSVFGFKYLATCAFQILIISCHLCVGGCDFFFFFWDCRLFYSIYMYIIITIQANITCSTMKTKAS